jgi:hypothetical protein
MSHHKWCINGAKGAGRVQRYTLPAPYVLSGWQISKNY